MTTCGRSPVKPKPPFVKSNPRNVNETRNPMNTPPYCELTLKTSSLRDRLKLLRGLALAFNAVFWRGKAEVAFRNKKAEAASPLNAWQPMATAPRNGREILILFGAATVPIARLCFWFDGVDLLTEEYREDEVGWWSYRSSVTQERIEEPLRPYGWIPCPPVPEALKEGLIA